MKIDRAAAGRDLERELVPMMESEKIGLLVWSPLAGGLLSGKFGRINQKPENSRRSRRCWSRVGGRWVENEPGRRLET